MSVNTSTYVGVAGTWTMNTSKSAPKPEKSFATDGTPESVFDPDHRSLVDDNDIKDGGKYRSIVKLQMRYEGQAEEDTAYAMGTGWLISPDTLVTAGHNVFDWSGYGQGLGRAVHIKAYIGYHGRENLESPIVQSRVAKEIVTTAEWVMSRENRHRDVAIIRLDRPFEGNLRCFTYKSTPKLAEEMIGVVGYPADKVLQYEDGRQEKGAQMYEQFNDVVYNIETDAKNPQGMIKYRISTFGGQSGAPIIRKGSKDTVIGTHVYGGGDKNQGNPIGKFGNDLDGLLKVFSGSLPTVSDYQGIKLVRYATAGTNGGLQYGVPVNNNGFSQTGFQQTPTAANSQTPESFIDDLAKVGKFVAGTFGKGLLQQPIFKNPKLGGPLAVAAGAALNALVNTAESGFSDPAAAARGVTERAALAEAALQTVLKLEEGPVMHKVISDMKQNYIRFAPSSYKTYATQLAPAIAKSANNILTTTNYNTQGTVIRGSAPNVPGIYAAESASDNSNEFLSHLLTTPTSQVEAEVQPEGFGFNFGGLGSIISSGFNIAKPFLGQAAKWGGQKLLDAAVSHLAGGAESALDGPSASPEDVDAAEILLKRAVMGEAALQAISKLSRRELQEASLLPGSAGPGEAAHAESWLSDVGDFFKSAVQTVAPIALKVAPVIVGALNPASAGGNNGYLAPPGGEDGLRKKRSVNDLLSEGLLQVSNT
ncbi:trypsin-like cysteine/serine peptidase domain-containing protein, partial [Cladorrhinum sp. PSN259]